MIKNEYKIDFPNKLEKIFDKLILFNIRPIVVGGYIRDYLLKKTSKDIDIELYNLYNPQQLESILSEEGKIYSVGKSFGVYKLHVGELELDFSFPRKDSKISQGHKGFKISIDSNLTFEKAASRRDFTINAIGYDVVEKKLLDPYNGIYDLEKKQLKAVNEQTFIEDPLRVLRAVGFASRLELTITPSLLNLLQMMVKKGMLKELPKERIFVELQKIVLKSKYPSKALKLLVLIGENYFFKEILSLTDEDFQKTCKSLDRCKKDMTLLIAVLTHKLSSQGRETFFKKVVHHKLLEKSVTQLISHQNDIDLNNYTHYDIYKLASEISIQTYCDFLHAIVEEKDLWQIDRLRIDAEKLNVLTQPLKPLLQGKDLIKMGFTPSKKFKEILFEAYEAQMNGEFQNHNEALQWVEKKYLSKV